MRMGRSSTCNEYFRKKGRLAITRSQPNASKKRPSERTSLELERNEIQDEGGEALLKAV